jgi:hypothetical protein
MGNPLLVADILPRNRPTGKQKSTVIPRRADGESPAVRGRSHSAGKPPRIDVFPRRLTYLKGLPTPALPLVKAGG